MYFSPNCTEADGEIVKHYLTARNIEAWNTRVIKHETDAGAVYDVRLASVDKDHKVIHYCLHNLKKMDFFFFSIEKKNEKSLNFVMICFYF